MSCKLPVVTGCWYLAAGLVGTLAMRCHEPQGATLLTGAALSLPLKNGSADAEGGRAATGLALMAGP